MQSLEPTTRKGTSTTANLSFKVQAINDTAHYCQSYVMCERVSWFGSARVLCTYTHYFLPLPRMHTNIDISVRWTPLSCTARLSSSKTDVVSTRREYSRTTHRINKIYSWTTHVRLSYFKTPLPHPIRSPSSAPAAASTIISTLRRTDFKGSPCKNLHPTSTTTIPPLLLKKTAVNVCSPRIFR